MNDPLEKDPFERYHKGMLDDNQYAKILAWGWGIFAAIGTVVVGLILVLT